MNVTQKVNNYPQHFRTHYCVLNSPTITDFAGIYADYLPDKYCKVSDCLPDIGLVPSVEEGATSEQTLQKSSDQLLLWNTF